MKNYLAGHVSQNWNTLCPSLINMANKLEILRLACYTGEVQDLDESSSSPGVFERFTTMLDEKLTRCLSATCVA